MTRDMVAPDESVPGAKSRHLRIRLSEWIPRGVRTLNPTYMAGNAVIL
jgi:hypothetical protein